MTARRGALAAAALSLVAIAVVRGGGGGPPLYDGVCLPQAYVTLGGNPGPGSGSMTKSSDQTVEVPTNDQPSPQAQVIVGGGSFAVPASTQITYTIKPVPAPAVKPPDGAIDGNAYEFTATGPGGQALTLLAGHPATIVLRATAAGGPTLVVEHFDGRQWSALTTVQSGCGDTEEAAAPALGVFALVAKGATAGPGGTVSPSPGGGSGPPILIIVLVVVAILGLLAGVARVSRSRAASRLSAQRRRGPGRRG